MNSGCSIFEILNIECSINPIKICNYKNRSKRQTNRPIIPNYFGESDGFGESYDEYSTQIDDFCCIPPAVPPFSKSYSSPFYDWCKLYATNTDCCECSYYNSCQCSDYCEAVMNSGCSIFKILNVEC